MNPGTDINAEITLTSSIPETLEFGRSVLEFTSGFLHKKMATIFVENTRQNPGYDSQPTRLWFNRDGSFIDGASTIGVVRADTTFSHSRHSPFSLTHRIGQTKTSRV